ncbi:hypothetical protein ACVWWJ_004481 [Luteibacter sp. HA06]
MNSNADAILTHAAVVQEAAAASDALLTGDVDEARFRIHLLVAKADIAGFEQVSRAAALLLARLGAPGNVPGTGYGACLIKLADELDSASPLTREARHRQVLKRGAPWASGDGAPGLPDVGR